MPILSKEDERYGYEPGSFAFWRNLAVYFCVFSVLGHWMEIVYCSFMNVFGIVDADSLVWDDPMYPFLVYGVGVVVCALVLMPLKTALAPGAPPSSAPGSSSSPSPWSCACSWNWPWGSC